LVFLLLLLERLERVTKDGVMVMSDGGGVVVVVVATATARASRACHCAWQQ
jgi:hypothetical protein